MEPASRIKMHHSQFPLAEDKMFGILLVEYMQQQFKYKRGTVLSDISVLAWMVEVTESILDIPPQKYYLDSPHLLSYSMGPHSFSLAIRIIISNLKPVSVGEERDKERKRERERERDRSLISCIFFFSGDCPCYFDFYGLNQISLGFQIWPHLRGLQGLWWPGPSA